VSALEFSGVTVRVGSGRHAFTAVDQVDLTIPAQTVLGLVGESGSGKSTLARAAVGLVRLESGHIHLDGFDLARARGRQARTRRRIQLVFQDPNGSLDPRMSVGESIGEAIIACRRMDRRSRIAEVRRLLDLVGLNPEHARLLPRVLSGGQRQRVALARALAAQPEVLIADEITSSLDVSVQGSVLNLVHGLQRELGFAMLFISHNLGIVRYVSDTVAVMYLGRIVEVGSADQVAATPQHPYTQALLEAVPRLGGTLDPTLDGPLDREPPDPHAPPHGCRFHTRCPVGPLARPERKLCTEVDPQTAAASRPNRAACHYVTRAT
jgi:peptide/nickel transport system ATP-binding protein